MAAPELRLDVRLNLATFRTDLGRAAQAAAAYYYPINLLINKQNLTKQLTAIGRSLGTTKYNIDLNDTSVDLAAGKIDKLAASLKKLSGSIQIDFNAGGGTKPIGTAMKEMAAKLAKESKGDINRAVEQMVGMRGASPFGAGTRSISGFKSAAKGMGIENAFKLFFQELQQVDPQSLKKALDDGSVMMMQENRELKQKFDKIQSSAEGLARDLRAMGETAKATGKASFTAGGKTLYPQNYGLKIASLLSQVEKLDKDLRNVSGQSGGELLNNLTELSSVLRTTSNSFVGLAGLSENLDQTLRGFDTATKAAASATIAYTERIRRRGGIEYGPSTQRLLPASSALSLREIGETMAQRYQAPSRGIKGLLPAGGKTPGEAITEAYIEELRRSFSSRNAIAGLLPPAVEPSPGAYRIARPAPAPPVVETRAELFARRTRQAYINSAARAADERQSPLALPPAREKGLGQPPLMRAPSIPASMGGGGGMPPRGGAYGGPGNFGQRGSGPGGGFNGPPLPGAGLVREIGNEFVFATKQVFLFGVAYKALAFLQSFPTQVGAAVGALQSFRNTLNAISPTAADAAASNQLIIDTVGKYNIPIQSARNGFTKLYASMKPAGFSGDQIGNLFLGISKASATLGLSSDKVDRVTYAFSQMASKGQLMSEEVSGQLGDVIPGALSIMAEAANMDIKTFKKAMEDGVFVGKAFETVMSNVPIVLEKRFGKGAEGAAKTFQGAINNMQTSLTFFYEAFEPVAVGFLNAVVKPISTGLQTLTDGFNAFFTGQAAQTSGGSALAKQLNDLRPSFDGILANLKQLVPSFRLFGNILLEAAKAFTVIAGNPIAGFLLKLYANVLLVNSVFTLLGGKILVTLISNIGAAITRFIAFGYAVNAVGIQTTGANTALAGTQLQMALLQKTAGMAIAPVNLLRTALTGLANFGLIAIAINVVINGLAELDRLKQSLEKIGSFSSAGYRKELKGMSKEDINSRLITNRATQASIKKELKDYQGPLGQAKGLTTGRDEELRARLVEVQSKEQELIKANRTAKPQVQLQSQVTGGTMGVIPPGDGGGATGAKAKEKKERESQIPQLMLQLEKTKELSAVEMQIVNAQLTSNTSQLSSLELLKRLIEFKYEAKSLALEDLTTEERALKYKEIGLRREQAIFENQLQLQIDLKKERDEIQQGFAATLAGYQEEANFQQMYLDLINQGVLPSLAKVRVEAEKAFAEGEKKLDQSIEQIQLNIAGLELTIEALKLEKNLTPEKQKQLEADEKRLEILKEDLRLRGLLKDTAPERKKAAVAAGERTLAPKTASEYLGEGLEAAQDRLKELTNIGYQVVQAANAIGDAFGEAFKGVITGSMTAREALAGFFQGIADYFADMVAQMIAEWLKAQLIQGFQSLFSAFVPGSSIAPGPVARSAGVVQRPGFYGPAFANGGIATGGFTAFANGGIVTGPTLGLVGEGRYNEAVIPLPDGKSVPVDLGGMAGGVGGEVTSNIVVNINNGQMQGNGNSNGSELGRKIEGAVKQVLVSELRPGGILSGGRR